MPKRSNDFQRLILLIEGQLAGQDAKVSESRTVRDLREGIDREIDVAIEVPQGSRSLLVAVECIDHKRKADVQWIDRLIGKYRDLPVDRVVAVSRAGFTKAALQKAALHRIDAIGFDEAERVDWSQALGTPIALTYQHIQAIPKRISYVVQTEFDFTEWPAEQIAAARVLTLTGEDIGSIKDICTAIRDEKHTRQQAVEAVTNSQSVRAVVRGELPPQSRMVFPNGQSCFLLAIDIELMYTREDVWVPLAHNRYGEAHVAHGQAVRTGHQIQTAAVRLPDGTIRGSLVMRSDAGRRLVVLENGEEIFRVHGSEASD